MHTAFVRTDTIVIEQSFINDPAPTWKETEGMITEAILPAKRSFGIIDLWSVRKRKRHFSVYRNASYSRFV